MSNWQILKLGEVSKSIKDGTHGTHKNVENGPFLLSAQNVENGRIVINENDRKISEKDFDAIHHNYKMQDNDILITIVGTLGRCAILTNYHNEFTFQRSVAIVRFDENKILPRFAFYQIQTNRFQRELKRYENKGAQGGVYLGELAKIPMIVPDLGTQQKIVQILDCICNIIDQNNYLIEKSEELFKIIVKKLIHNTSGSMQLSFEKCYNVLPKIKGIKREQYQKNGKYPIIDQQKDRIISGRTNNEHLVIEMNKPCIVFGDHSRAVKYINQGKHAFGNDGIKIISTREMLDDYFGYLSILNLDIPNTGYNRHFKYLKSTVFTIPDMTTQKQIANICLNIESQIKMSKLRSLLFKNQYKYLLNHLISGDYDLTNIKLENGKEQQ